MLLAQWNMDLPFPFGPDQICSEAVDLTWAGVRYVVIHRVEGRNARSGHLERCGFPVVSETDDTLVLDLTSRADQ